ARRTGAPGAHRDAALHRAGVLGAGEPLRPRPRGAVASGPDVRLQPAPPVPHPPPDEDRPGLVGPPRRSRRAQRHLGVDLAARPRLRDGARGGVGGLHRLLAHRARPATTTRHGRGRREPAATVRERRATPTATVPRRPSAVL
ncbi:MAG: hypothetical protein AVDCRST_MAG35-1652, partial [uncultured Quadrisphaera sp.]